MASRATREHNPYARQRLIRTPSSTLKVYRNGTPTDYTGPRKADGIVIYMTK